MTDKNIRIKLKDKEIIKHYYFWSGVRISLIIIATILTLTFCLLLMKSYGFPQIVRTEVFLADTIVRADNEASQKLSSIYYEDLGNEVPVCLYGKEPNNTITIEHVRIPKITESNRTHSSYKKCSDHIGSLKLFGSIHNHPSGICELSETDIKSHLGKMLKENHELSGLYCEGKYMFYTINQVQSEI